MRMSAQFSQTLREAPADAEVASHVLLLRAGFIRQLASGIFSYLPLARRAFDKIEAIIREEIDAIGGQEITMPVVHPADIWKETGRWYDIDAEMGRFSDRSDRDMVLAMTHEEVVADLVRREIKSYRQLPQLLYHLQTKWRDDPRPLYVLVWGTIEDVAQALHDDPAIKNKLRVYFIAGPNKKWSPAAYNYIEQNHPDLWIIENNSTYRGWFEGRDQSGDLGNRSFVETHIRGSGALGYYFTGHLGGRFVRAWERPKRVFDRLTTYDDELETFGLLELVLPGPKGAVASLVVDGQEFPASYEGPLGYRFRFVPKETKRWSCQTRSTAAELDGLEGAFTSVDPVPDATSRPSARHPHWWTDDPDRAFAEGPHLGAVTVNRWREEFLRDFAARIRRCKIVASAGSDHGLR